MGGVLKLCIHNINSIEYLSEPQRNINRLVDVLGGPIMLLPVPGA